MIEAEAIYDCRENEHLEAKRAVCGLPESLWETYSAFANTRGGVILLGVEEYPDGSLRAVDLPDPSGLLQDFWEIVNDEDRVSTNILCNSDVRELNFDGKHIIVIHVPRAPTEDLPVYLGRDPQKGTYIRINSSDVRCSPEDVFRLALGQGLPTTLTY